MSRSGYSEDCDNAWQLIMYRGRVASAIRGARGQIFMRDLVEALDAMPVRRLIEGELQIVYPGAIGGEVCALGALGVKRGVQLEGLDPEDAETVADRFNIAAALAREVVYENDEGGPYYATNEPPELRWQRMRAWAVSNLKDPTHDRT